MPKLVLMYSSATAPAWWAQAFRDHDIGFYDPNCCYDPASTVFYHDMYGEYPELLQSQLEQGFKVIFDAKNEHYIPDNKAQWLLNELGRRPGQGMILISGQTPVILPGIKIAATPYWYWIMDQISWRNQKLDTWRPQRNPQHTFFMQISLSRDDRQMLYSQLINSNLLDNCLHSFRDLGIFLPDDIDPATYSGNWQRYINPKWYEQTWFSLTVETYIDGTKPTGGTSFTQDDNLFLCEKSYKAMACQHPFVLASTYRNLNYIRTQGFETFPELFDESYDHILDTSIRIRALCDSVKNFRQEEFYNPRVQEKIRHNHARFFNRALTHRFLQETIVQPVLDFVYE